MMSSTQSPGFQLFFWGSHISNLQYIVIENLQMNDMGNGKLPMVIIGFSVTNG